MAKITEARLTHEQQDPRVLFTVNADAEFEEQELGHEWLFEVTLMEDDPIGDDRLGRKRYYFTPDERQVALTREIDMGWAQVRTEPGKEEVYAKLRLAPTETPSNAIDDQTRTNTVKVDV